MSPDHFLASLAGGQLGGADSDFVIVEWADSGDSGYDWIAPLHVHNADDEAWYVLEGVLCIQRGDEIVEARAGSAVLVTQGTPHTYWNPGPDRARYLLVMTGNTYGLIQAIHAASDRSPANLRPLFAAYDSELL